MGSVLKQGLTLKCHGGVKARRQTEYSWFTEVVFKSHMHPGKGLAGRIPRHVWIPYKTIDCQTLSDLPHIHKKKLILWVKSEDLKSWNNAPNINKPIDSRHLELLETSSDLCSSYPNPENQPETHTMFSNSKFPAKRLVCLIIHITCSICRLSLRFCLSLNPGWKHSINFPKG